MYVTCNIRVWNDGEHLTHAPFRLSSVFVLLLSVAYSLTHTPTSQILSTAVCFPSIEWHVQTILVLSRWLWYALKLFVWMPPLGCEVPGVDLMKIQIWRFLIHMPYRFISYTMYIKVSDTYALQIHFIYNVYYIIYICCIYIYIYIIYTHWHAEWRPIGLATMSVSACLAWSGSSAFSACPRLWMPFCCMSLSAQAFHWATKSTEAILSIGTLTLPTIGEQVRITVIDN